LRTRSLDHPILKRVTKFTIHAKSTSKATRVSRHEFVLKLAEGFNLNTNLIKPANAVEGQKTERLLVKRKQGANSTKSKP